MKENTRTHVVEILPVTSVLPKGLWEMMLGCGPLVRRCDRKCSATEKKGGVRSKGNEREDVLFVVFLTFIANSTSAQP